MTEDDADDLPQLLEGDDDEDDPDFEEGVRMFAAGLRSPSAEICATSTISQRLTEAFKRNSEPALLSQVPSDVKSEILDYLREFEDVFSKESFDVLPESKPWDTPYQPTLHDGRTKTT